MPEGRQIAVELAAVPHARRAYAPVALGLAQGPGEALVAGRGLFVAELTQAGAIAS